MDLTAVIRSFKKQKVVTIDQLASWLSCSVVTARRRLKAWRAYTSYNRNGRYYTLPEIAQFDDIGLWRYQGAFFSKHGNLKQTLVHLVTHAAYSRPNLPPIPAQACHPFQTKAATDSRAKLPPWQLV